MCSGAVFYVFGVLSTSVNSATSSTPTATRSGSDPRKCSGSCPQESKQKEEGQEEEEVSGGALDLLV